jgi:hypothetical protein
MKKITIEEHFAIQEQLDASHAIITGKYPIPEVTQEERLLDRELPFLYPSIHQNTVHKLLDMGEGRIQDMDRDGIDM